MHNTISKLSDMLSIHLLHVSIDINIEIHILYKIIQGYNISFKTEIVKILILRRKILSSPHSVLYSSYLHLTRKIDKNFGPLPRCCSSSPQWERPGYTLVHHFPGSSVLFPRQHQPGAGKFCCRFFFYFYIRESSSMPLN